MTDHDLRQHVENALDWEPSVDSGKIAISVDNGIVTVRGDVSSYAQKHTAERVALRVYGVKAVANDITVRLADFGVPNDSDIAKAAADALHWNAQVPPNRVSITVEKGWITLGGALDWEFQRAAAERSVRSLRGATGVSNTIVLRTVVTPADVKSRIEQALKRSAEVDARRINVATADGKVILTGHVRSWAERQEAERAAWAAPGVALVDDRITITP